MNHFMRFNLWGVVILASVTVFTARPASAADRQYTISSGNWATDANWTSGSRPLSGDRAFIGGLYPSGDANTAEVTVNTDESAQTLSEIWVGGYTGSPGGAGTLNIQSGANLLTGGRTKVGGGVTGVVHQTGGVFTWTGGADIVVGANDGGPNPGFYNLSGGTMTGMANLFVGVGFTAGSFTMSGGSIVNNGNLYVGLSGAAVFTQSGGTNTVGAALRLGEWAYADSRYELSGGRLVVNGGPSYVGIFTGSNTFHQSGGTAIFQQLDLGYLTNGIYHLSGGDLNATILNKTAGSALNFTGGTLSANTINFSVVNNGGTLAPGRTNSIGTTTISGGNNYTQGLTATLALQIGGTSQGTTYDWLHVSGTANLDGNLTVSLVNDFTPLASDVFTNLTAGSVIGTFANAPVSGNKYDLGGGHHFIVTYHAGSVVLSGYEFLQAIPEPTTILLLGLGGWLIYRRARRP